MRNLGALVLGSIFLLILGCGGGQSTPPPPPPMAAPPPVTLSLSPSSAKVALSTSQKFTVIASSGTPPAVTWSVNGITGGNSTIGTIDTTGNYTAPATFPSPNTVTVTATSQSNGAANATVTIVFPNNTSSAQTAPIKLGTSGGNNTDLTTTVCCSGTLGSLVTRDKTFFILSNNHVLDKSGQGKVGDPIGQPGLVDNNCSPATTVANLTQAAPLQTANVDAAIAQIVSGEVDTTGSILDLGAQGPSSIAAAPPSATLAVPATVLSSNEGVAKVGRTSGLTCSTLQSVSTSVQVDYSNTCGGPTAFTVTFTNQVVIAGGSFSAAGDSGSLVVTSDTARPVGLLFAGSASDTVANPIADVLNALQNTTTKSFPTVVGGADHAVSCAPTAPASTQLAPGTLSTSLSPAEVQRATDVKDQFAFQLMQDPAVSGVGVGASLDHPGEAALVVFISGSLAKPVPPEIEGVRTRLVFGSRFSAQEQAAGTVAQVPVLGLVDIGRAISIKEAHVAELMGQAGMVGVGVGRSEDAPGEPALVIFVEKGKLQSAIPPEIDGVRTRIIEGDRFRAFGWGEKPQALRRCPARLR